MSLVDPIDPYSISRVGPVSHDLRTRVERCRRIYGGDFEETFATFKQRFQSSDVSAGQGVSRRDFLLINELKPAINRMVEAMPATFTFGVDTKRGGVEAVAEQLNKWAGTRIAGPGRSLFSAFRMICKRQVIDGYVPIVVTLDGDTPQVRIRDAAQAVVETDPLTGELERVTFEWLEPVKQGAGPKDIEAATLRQVIDRQASTISRGQEKGIPTPHGLGFVPVVLIPLRDEGNSLLAPSYIEDAEEAYLAFLKSWYLLSIANNYEAHGLYCDDPAAEDSGDTLDDDVETGPKTIATFPGGYVPKAIKKVGGNINPTSILAAIDRTLQALHHQCKVRLESQVSTDNRSGKAKLIDTAEMRADVSIRSTILKDRLEQLGEIVWQMMGNKLPEGGLGLTVELPCVDEVDQQEQRERGKLLLEARLAGELTREQFFEGWYALGLFDEDLDPKILAQAAEAEAESQKEAEAEDLTNRLLKARQPPPGQAPGATPPPMDMEHDEDEGVMADG